MWKVNNPYSGFSPGTPVFTHYTTARQWCAPHDMAKINDSKIEKVSKMGILKNTPVDANWDKKHEFYPMEITIFANFLRQF